jgi:hypothetical protein
MSFFVAAWRFKPRVIVAFWPVVGRLGTGIVIHERLSLSTVQYGKLIAFSQPNHEANQWLALLVEPAWLPDNAHCRPQLASNGPRFDFLNDAGKFVIEWPGLEPMIVAFREDNEHIRPREQRAG